MRMRCSRCEWSENDKREVCVESFVLNVTLDYPLNRKFSGSQQSSLANRLRNYSRRKLLNNPNKFDRLKFVDSLIFLEKLS